jgi:hypothetical protein
MRRLFTICLLALSATALLVSAPASSTAGSEKASKPSITRVLPMRVGVGGTLTITGENFKSARSANTVIFRASNGRSAFAKPRRASRGKLKVVVPGSVSRLLAGTLSKPKPTRLKLRVLAGEFSSFTPRRLSPVVTGFPTDEASGGGPTAPGGGSASPSGGSGAPGGGAVTPPSVPVACDSSPDHDGDLLVNTLESEIGTKPCLADTDGDGVEDGYEYKSAIDLNDDEFQEPNASLPYPGKKPYPNPLDPTDADKDFDGDVLTLAEEQKLWRYTEVRTLFDLTYSDGEQYSMRTRDANNRRVPTLSATGYSRQSAFLDWASGAGYRTVMLSDEAPWWNHEARNTYALLDFNRDGSESNTVLPGYARAETKYYDFDRDTFLSDNERDEDADGLTNYDETHGRMTPGYWTSCYPNEAPDFIEYEGVDVTDPDTDGDGVRDGADDQDHDDVPNLMELSRLAASGLWDALRDCKVIPNLHSTNVTVEGGPLPNTVLVTFEGELAGQDVPEMTADGAGLTDGTVSVSTHRQGGDGVDEQQAVTITGPPSDGDFTLAFDGKVTTALEYDASASAVETALRAVLSDPKLNHSKAYGRVNPFNRCLPADWARICTLHDGFQNNGAPFDDSVNWYSLN